MISHDCGVIYLNIPFSGGESFNKFYVDRYKGSMKRIEGNNENEIKQNTEKYIHDFYDYDLFTIVKNPYHRAVDMWLNAQSKFKRTSIKKQSISEYFENLLNKWDCSDEDYISYQTDYLIKKDNHINYEVKNIFHVEDLINGKFDRINLFLEDNYMPSMSFYIEEPQDENWRDYYNKDSIEIINYIFDEDFEYCGYGKI